MEVLVFKYSARPVRHIGVLDSIEVYITDTFFMQPDAAPYPPSPSIDQMGMSSLGRRVPRVVVKNSP